MDTMLSAAINFTITKKINSLTIPNQNPRTTLSVTSQKHPIQSSRNKKIPPFLTHCSPKPNTDKENPTENQNPNFQPTPNPPNSPIPTSIQPLLSPNPSFSRGLVFDLGPSHSWDSSEIGSPVVKRFLSDDEERWYMWYHGSSGKDPVGPDSIGLAVSSNGVVWERGGGSVKSSNDVGVVMNCGKDWWAFDTSSVRPSEVVIMSSSKVRAGNAFYWLYYTGFSSEKVESRDDLGDFVLENPERARRVGDVSNESDRNLRAFKSFPGLAMSQDGRHWARIEGEHHSGALFDLGSNGGWDSLFIASPQVVFHQSGDLRMYYHSFDSKNGVFGIGLARSRDGIKWVKLGRVIGGGKAGAFDELGATNPRVLKNKKDETFVMVYEGVSANGMRSIGLASSKDGLKNWERFGNEAILEASEGDGWDSRGVGMPCLVEMDGDKDQWRLYYRGIGKGGESGIGLAVSQGSDFRSFRRWSGFHLQDTKMV